MPAAADKDNELLNVARLSMVVCRRHLQSYSCPKSPHRFTQPQLMTCLVLKTYLKRTYRGVADLLRLSDGLRDALGLGRVPAHATLKEFERRAVTPDLLDGVVGQVFALLREHGLAVEELAVDSTGVEASPASAHFVSRAGKRRGRYVKLSLAVACGSVTLAAAVGSSGPAGNDLVEAPAVLWRAAGRCRPAFAYADRGYDAEWFHRFCRDGWGPLSYVPPVPKTRDGSVRTECRGRCARLRPAGAGRRWHAESFIGGMKRTCGSAVAARGERSMLNEALLKALAYAIRR